MGYGLKCPTLVHRAPFCGKTSGVNLGGYKADLNLAATLGRARRGGANGCETPFARHHRWC